MPSVRRKSARVGQIVTHGASAHWLQRTGKNKRRVVGKAPFSTLLTQQRLTPIGIWCSALQAIVHAWQPMHLRRSMAKPYVGTRLRNIAREAQRHSRHREKMATEPQWSDHTEFDREHTRAAEKRAVRKRIHRYSNHEALHCALTALRVLPRLVDQTSLCVSVAVFLCASAASESHR